MKPKNVLVMLGLVVVCVLVWLFALRGRSSTPAGTLPAYWPKLEKTDVSALAIRGEGREVKLRRRPESSDRWDEIVGTEIVRADPNRIDDLLTALSHQNVRARYEQASLSAANLAEYGLDKPQVEVDATIADKPVTLRYGKLSREGAKVYMDTGPGTDVWIVSKDAMDAALSGLSAGGFKSKRLFDLGTFDVAKLEIVKDGVTTAELVKDSSLIWHVTQPFKGYAEETRFEPELNRIVNVDVLAWEEFGAPDLEKYGLAKPSYEVRVTPKGEGKKPHVVLVGKFAEDHCFAMEAGTRSVASVGKAFWDAVTKDPSAYRDHSFTRLGFDGDAIDVQVGDVHYKLERGGSTWDVLIGSERRPAEGDRVAKLLEKIRAWRTDEFLDAQKPEDVGLDGKNYVEIALRSGGGGKLTLLLTKPDEQGLIYGQRKGDGGVERVDPAPLVEMLRGPQQYFRNTAFNFPPNWVLGIERDTGYSDEGQKVQAFKIRREAEDKPWKREGGPGQVGEPIGQAISDFLEAIRGDKAGQTIQWLPFSPEKDNERMGFRPPKAATMTIRLQLNASGLEDASPEVYVGVQRPEGDGFYARFASSKSWAFVLPNAIVEALKRDFFK